jgi:hypothetical protein
MKPSVFAWGLLAFAAAPSESPAATPSRYLFLDPALLREVQGATLRVNPPLVCPA